MKKMLFIFSLIVFSCTPEEKETSSQTPETFQVRYEILGYGEVPKVIYGTNETVVEMEWDEDEVPQDVSGVRLPFVKDFNITAKRDGEMGRFGSIGQGCITLFISAYASKNDGTIQEINIYVDGVLKDSKKEGYYYSPGEHWTPWGSAKYTYLRIGSDPEKFPACN